MPLKRTSVSVLLLAAAAMAQPQQEGSRPGWPCVAGRAVDSSYIEISESTGGMLFLLQKGESENAGPLLAATQTHKATLLRAVGQLTGAREFSVPVDGSVRSLFVAVAMQCRQAIAVLDPREVESTPANAVLSHDLQTGKLVRVDAPGTGNWRVRVSGQGLVVVMILADTDVRLQEVRAVETPLRIGSVQKMRVHFNDEITEPRFSLIDAMGETVGPATPAESADGEYVIGVVPKVERFRIACDGLDEMGHAIRRVHPVLFRAN